MARASSSLRDKQTRTYDVTYYRNTTPPTGASRRVPPTSTAPPSWIFAKIFLDLVRLEVRDSRSQLDAERRNARLCGGVRRSAAPAASERVTTAATPPFIRTVARSTRVGSIAKSSAGNNSPLVRRNVIGVPTADVHLPGDEPGVVRRGSTGNEHHWPLQYEQAAMTAHQTTRHQRSPSPKLDHHRHRLPFDDVHALVLAIRDIEVLLRGIFGKRDVHTEQQARSRRRH